MSLDLVNSSDLIVWWCLAFPQLPGHLPVSDAQLTLHAVGSCSQGLVFQWCLPLQLPHD